MMSNALTSSICMNVFPEFGLAVVHMNVQFNMALDGFRDCCNDGPDLNVIS